MVLPLHSPEDKITSGNIPSFRIPMGIPYGREELTNLGPWISCPTWLFWHGTERKWLSSHVAKNIAPSFLPSFLNLFPLLPCNDSSLVPKDERRCLVQRDPCFAVSHALANSVHVGLAPRMRRTLSASANPFKFRLPQSLLDTACLNSAQVQCQDGKIRQTHL